MSDIIGQILIAIGLCFTFLGCVGLIRMPDVYCRLQAATKCVTLGTGSILLAALVMTGISGTGVKAMVCLVFLFLNSPTAAHALAKASNAAGIKVWQKPGSRKNSE
ncbi:MAG TPA: monovalent cation/H(+) antiporter subunit G [bacterium]|jgi:multicomponent Na+:H+ antiporter subunit G|nr:monovalent cation/H(+) antiporter subunit G [bacterium]